ncbi:chalcone isomerase family protein [Kiritimatiellaeota bacterium B1221]|nr:chalcone isomerase family protein [Kiritimatiellaeota bacterium B1221]
MKAIPSLMIIWLGLLPAAYANETVKVKDHRYPVQLEAQESVWTLEGTEHFKYKAIFSVFTAAYYTQTGGDGQKLHFTYTRKLKADDLRGKAMETLRNQNDHQTLQTYEALTARIQAAYEDVKDGDAYIITVDPEKGTWLHLNGNEIFFTDNAAFGKWYLDIWLGNPPANASLKKALLN